MLESVNMDINTLVTALDNIEENSPNEPTTSRPIQQLIPGTPSYYRSKVFIAQNSINPLAAAASGVIGLITQLHFLNVCSNPEQLHHNFKQELEDFEVRASARDINHQKILATRFTLSTLIDETMSAKHWLEQARWQPLNQWDNQRLFMLIDRCALEPQRNIDLMEMLYLCFSLGLKGPFSQQANGQQLLQTTIDKLFYLIRQQRGLKSNSLITNTMQSKSTNIKVHKTPIWLAIPFAGILLTALYGGLNSHLQYKTNQVQQTMNSIIT